MLLSQLLVLLLLLLQFLGGILLYLRWSQFKMELKKELKDKRNKIFVKKDK